MSQSVFITEFGAISHGIRALDDMLKRSSLFVLHAAPICIGKYLIVVGGDVADTRVAAACAAEHYGEGKRGSHLGSYLLTGAHPAILEYFAHTPTSIEPPEAVGIFEATNAAAGFKSLDAALKSGRVSPVRVWLGQLLGGKFCYVLGGSVSDVNAAVAAAKSAIEEKEHVGTEVIPAPDRDTLAILLRGRTG